MASIKTLLDSFTIIIVSNKRAAFSISTNKFTLGSKAN